MRKLIIESENDLDELVRQFESSITDAQEKMNWKKAVKECIQELGLQAEAKWMKKTIIYLAAMAALGIATRIPFLIGMGTIPTALSAYMDREKIKKVIECARKKMSEYKKSKKIEKPIGENKKIIRLKESELISIVKKVIKENKK